MIQPHWIDHKRPYIVVAERALGKPLPKGAQVHHVNGDTHDNRSRNLVICQSDSYHKLLHKRTRILRTGGNPNTQGICTSCKQLINLSDKPWIYGKRFVCRPCQRANKRSYYHRIDAARRKEKARGLQAR
jgi:hypothetical protein